MPVLLDKPESAGHDNGRHSGARPNRIERPLTAGIATGRLTDGGDRTGAAVVAVRSTMRDARLSRL